MANKYLLIPTQNPGELTLICDYGDGWGSVVETGEQWSIRELKAIIEGTGRGQEAGSERRLRVLE